MEDQPDIVTPATAIAGAQVRIMPTGDAVVFPTMVFPIVVRDEPAVQLISDAAAADRNVALFSLKNPEESVTADNLNDLGALASIIRLMRAPDGSVHVIMGGSGRVRLVEVTQREPYLMGLVEMAPETVVESTEVEALQRSLLSIFQRIVGLSPTLGDEVAGAASQIEDPARLADFVASALDLSHAQKLELLNEGDVLLRMRRLTELTTQELEVLELGSEIQNRIRAEMDKGQREYFLREQLRQIQQELGQLTGEQSEVAELRRQIEEAGLPEPARKQAEDELGRLERIPPASPEYGIIRTYLDWIVSLPWSTSTDDNLNLAEARSILDEDHYDLENIKDRILEYLAVHRLRGEVKGPILCFVGPPGVGKTSLGQSIARALNRTFVRISLGGVRDEAEIRGHRRTYIGAMPGRIIQGLRRAGSNNPVFMLDEVDKVTVGFQGDPSAALLEVLDPAQNSTFSDHYIDVPFDLSRIVFIATANVLDTIPPPLRDRMEIIELSGYTEEEKLHIAKRYLLPRQKEENGLRPSNLSLPDSVLKRIIADYTREAGVRGLERQIGTIARKAAREVAEGSVKRVRVTEKALPRYLGSVRFRREIIEQGDETGVVTGMAWTPVGGDVLFVEASMVPGRGNLILTGQLGEVMQESARAALTYVRSRASQLGLPTDFYENYDFHVHVPAGSIPKDGPSAGITMATALISAATGRPVSRDVAMTGEITLRGRVLPIGGLKDKVLAAHRAGVRTVILPADNEQDIQEIPQDVRNDLRFEPVDHMDQVTRVALDGLTTSPKNRSRPRHPRGPVAAAT